MKEEKCINCEERFDEGDEYINEPLFGEKLCVDCIDELRQTLIDASDWHSLMQLDDGDCEVKEFAVHAKDNKVGGSE